MQDLLAPPAKEGWLYVLAQTKKRWKKRYAVLTSNSLLGIYKTQTDQTPKHCYDLRNYTSVTHVPSKKSDYWLRIEPIVTPITSTKRISAYNHITEHVALHVYAPSAILMREWISELELHLGSDLNIVDIVLARLDIKSYLRERSSRAIARRKKTSTTETPDAVASDGKSNGGIEGKINEHQRRSLIRRTKSGGTSQIPRGVGGINSESQVIHRDTPFNQTDVSTRTFTCASPCTGDIATLPASPSFLNSSPRKPSLSSLGGPKGPRFCTNARATQQERLNANGTATLPGSFSDDSLSPGPLSPNPDFSSPPTEYDSATPSPTAVTTRVDFRKFMVAAVDARLQEMDQRRSQKAEDVNAYELSDIYDIYHTMDDEVTRISIQQAQFQSTPIETQPTTSQSRNDEFVAEPDFYRPSRSSKPRYAPNPTVERNRYSAYTRPALARYDFAPSRRYSSRPHPSMDERRLRAEPRRLPLSRPGYI